MEAAQGTFRVAIVDYARTQYDATLYEECDGAHLFSNCRIPGAAFNGRRRVDPDSFAGWLRLCAAAE